MLWWRASDPSLLADLVEGGQRENVSCLIGLIFPLQVGGDDFAIYAGVRCDFCVQESVDGEKKNVRWVVIPSRGWGETQAAPLLLMQKDFACPLAHRRHNGSTRVKKKKSGGRLPNAQLHRGVICHTCHSSHLHICVCSWGSKVPHRKAPYCKRHMCTWEEAGERGARRHVCLNVIGGSGGYSWLGAATPSTRPATWIDPFSIN